MAASPFTTDEMPVMVSPQELRRQLAQLQDRLAGYVEQDPNLVIDGPALAMVDTLMAHAALHFSDHPMIRRFATASAPTDPNRRPMRACDLLIAVDLILHALP